MARIRKSVEDASSLSSSGPIWRIAAYIRLSREDGNDESLSVTNQKKIIGEYLETFFAEGFVFAGYYIEIKIA